MSIVSGILIIDQMQPPTIWKKLWTFPWHPCICMYTWIGTQTQNSCEFLSFINSLVLNLKSKSTISLIRRWWNLYGPLPVVYDQRKINFPSSVCPLYLLTKWTVYLELKQLLLINGHFKVQLSSLSFSSCRFTRSIMLSL